MCASFCMNILSISLGYNIPRRRLARSYNNSVFCPLGNCQTVFQSDCTVLLSYQQCMRVPISLHSQHLSLSVLIIAILVYSSYKSLNIFMICKHFFRTMGCLFIFLMVFFDSKNFLILLKFNISVFFVVCTFDVISKKPLPNLRSQRVTSVFSSKNFIVLALKLRSSIPFELIIVHDM